MKDVNRSMANPPDAATFDQLAHKAIQQLPQVFRDRLVDVVIRVEEFADQETLVSVGLDDPWELLGLYHGRPLSEQSIWSSGDLPSVISLFRRPLLKQWSETGASLEDIVTHVIVHEAGHFFGLSDDEMHAIENEP
jgi:predicted Zn-dependent protease with MMP-like domain